MKYKLSLFMCVTAFQGSLIANTPSSTVASPTQVNETQMESGLTKEQEAELAAWMIEASRVAQEYVNMLDRKQYAQSWSSGAQLFQSTIPQREWETALHLSRERLGAATSRTLKDQRPAFDPKGLPKGAYMVVEYKTSFENAPQSGELLTLMRERDGKWKVLTYQVN